MANNQSGYHSFDPGASWHHDELAAGTSTVSELDAVYRPLPHRDLVADLLLYVVDPSPHENACGTACPGPGVGAAGQFCGAAQRRRSRR